MLSESKTWKFRNQADSAACSLQPGPTSTGPNSIKQSRLYANILASPLLLVFCHVAQFTPWKPVLGIQFPGLVLNLQIILPVSLYQINWKYFRKSASREKAWEPGSSTPLIHNKLCSDDLLKGGRIIWEALVTWMNRTDNGDKPYYK